MHFFFCFFAAAELNTTDSSNCLGYGAKKHKQLETNEEKLSHSFLNHTTHFHVVLMPSSQSGGPLFHMCQSGRLREDYLCGVSS